MLFTLSDEEKCHFILIIYNIAMFDDYFSDAEKLIITSLERDIFKIEPVPKVLIPEMEELAGKLNRIGSVEAVKYLFKIGCGMVKFCRGKKGEFLQRLRQLHRFSKYRELIEWEEVCPTPRPIWEEVWERLKGVGRGIESKGRAIPLPFLKEKRENG
jgi:hypothetical protein